MNSATTTAPYIHTDESYNSRAKDWLVAISPILVWSTYMFGARVITLTLLGALFSLALDYAVRRFVFRLGRGARFDLNSAVYGILAIFAIPVTAPLWFPAVTSILVVLAKSIRFRSRNIFNPFVFSAAITSIAFKSIMTAYTRPFAYFSAFDIALDPKLVDNYRVISPLQYMADGKVYEDGVIAQLYGFASGNIGEIAVAAIILAFAFLLYRKEADWRGTASFLIPVLLLALALPSSDAESNYYAYSVLLSGGIAFLSVFAMNENGSIPFDGTARMIFGAVCGILTFFLRKYAGGFEWGYVIVLVMNLSVPLFDKFFRPRVKK